MVVIKVIRANSVTVRVVVLVVVRSMMVISNMNGVLFDDCSGC